MDRIIMHIDVNNAFLSWTAVKFLKEGSKYDIREGYSVIGGDEKARRGIVLAKSPQAKKRGIVTGETLYAARKKCPSLRIYQPNYIWYQKMSNQLFDLLSKYTCDLEICSIDECFLDYTPIKKLYGDQLEFAKKIKEEVKVTLGFTVNIGIANNKLCAKMASDFSKPDKIHTLYKDEVKNKMYPLPIEDLFGIGKKTSYKLRQLNINTINDLAKSDDLELYKYFKNQAVKMIDVAKGIDNSEVISTKEENKGISNSTTLSQDLIKNIEVYQILEAISNNIAIELRRQDKYAYVVCVHLKDQFFKSYSHQQRLKNATNLTKEIFDISKKLFDEMWKGEPIRLVGIRLDNLVINNHHQLSIFEKIEEIDNDIVLEKIVDELKDKFGNKIIKPASLHGNTVGFKNMKKE